MMTKTAIKATLARRQALVVMGGLLALSLGAAGCKKRDKDTHVVGVLVPLTGGAAAYGKNSKRGVELAVKHFRQKHPKIKIKLKIEDSQGKPAIGTKAALKLMVRDKAVAIIGDVTSGVTIAAKPLLDDHKVPMVSPGASSPNLAVAGDYVFRTWPSDTLEAEAMARELIRRKVTKLAILRINNEYGLALEKALRKQLAAKGGSVKIVKAVSFEQGAREMRTQILKVKDSGAAAIYFVGFPEAAIVFGRGYAEAGLSLPVFATSAFEDKNIPKKTGKALEGTIYTKPILKSGKAKEFAAAYQKAYGEKPGLTSDTAYDAAMVVLRAIAALKKKGKSVTGKAIRAELEKTTGYTGPTGTIRFDANGDVQSTVGFFTLRDGKYQPVKR